MTDLTSGSLNDAWERAYASRSGGALWQDAPIPQLAFAIETLKDSQAAEVLDLGCGDGRNLVALARAGLQASGVDASPTACARARQNASLLGLDVTVWEADAENLPLPSASVDAVICFDVFTHFLDPGAVLFELRRVIRPGGLLIFNAYSVNDSEYGVGENVAPRQFLFKDTLFRFYERAEVLELLEGWDVLSCDEEFWDDPPHGDFRPYPHRHGAYVLAARRAA